MSVTSAFPSVAPLNALLPQCRKSVDGPCGEVWKAERARPF